MKYSPTFTKIVVNKDTNKIGVRKIGYLELFKNAVGISLPEKIFEENSNVYYNLK